VNWVQRMKGICNAAEETSLSKFIYDQQKGPRFSQNEENRGLYK